MAEQLESLLNSKQRLLRDVSHELRSPLTRLQLSLALARRKTPEASAEHDRIEREIERLDQLIGQIIRYSRIQHGVSEQAWEHVDLQQLVKQLVDDGDFEAQACNKAVVLTRSSEIRLRAVRDFISSAIENIIRNAIRFTPEESSIEVTLEQVDSQVVIRVRDYGPGVPEDTLESLFDPFFRVDETRGKENNGTGLGMAIAHGAVSFHKGTIVASNASPGLQVEIRTTCWYGLMNDNEAGLIVHDWNISPSEAIVLQRKLATQVICQDRLAAIKYVAGVDVGFEDKGQVTRAAIAVLRFPDLSLVEYAIAPFTNAYALYSGATLFSGVPGYY